MVSIQKSIASKIYFESDIANLVDNIKDDLNLITNHSSTFNEVGDNLEFVLEGESINEMDAEKLFEEGIAFARSGSIANAKETLTKSITLNPTVALVWRNLGSTALNEGKLEEAKSIFRVSLLLDALDEYSWLGLSNSYSKKNTVTKKELEIAIELLEIGIVLNPESYLVLNNLAATYDRLGFPEKAELLYTKSISNNNKDQRPYLGRALMYLNQHKLNEAISDLEACYDLNPISPQGRLANEYLSKLN